MGNRCCPSSQHDSPLRCPSQLPLLSHLFWAQVRHTEGFIFQTQVLIEAEISITRADLWDAPFPPDIAASEGGCSAKGLHAPVTREPACSGAA